MANDNNEDQKEEEETKTLQEKYDEIMNCLSMMKHFECTNRFR